MCDCPPQPRLVNDTESKKFSIFQYCLFFQITEQFKKKVHDVTGVPICRQAIRGWPPAKLSLAQIPTTQLSSLGLSGENELILIDLTEEGYMDFEKYYFVF